ncbi:transposase [Saccharopolyspora shandongensis]|uniref:transposase n=1 Tax=Saccharopolyspora shandongensis TaxID=418495 RepID=UPI003414B046
MPRDHDTRHGCSRSRLPRQAPIEPRLTHGTGTVAGQRQVLTGANEIVAFEPLLDTINLDGAVVTADALHDTRAHARYLHQRGAYYVFTVKENNARLHGQLDSLPWHEIPTFTTEKTGHGRTERRTTRLAPLGDFHGWPAIDFPHAFLIERHTITNATGKARADAALGITNITGHHAHKASIHTFIRGLAISALRLAGHTNVAQALRHMSRDFT